MGEPALSYTDEFSFKDNSLIYETTYKAKDTLPPVKFSSICHVHEGEYKLLADYIEVMGLNKDFTYVPAEAKENGYLENIKISVIWDGVSSKIELMGYKYVLKREDIYKKVILFIDTIRNLAEKCKNNK